MFGSSLHSSCNNLLPLHLLKLWISTSLICKEKMQDMLFEAFIVTVCSEVFSRYWLCQYANNVPSLGTLHFHHQGLMEIVSKMLDNDSILIHPFAKEDRTTFIS